MIELRVLVHELINYLGTSQFFWLFFTCAVFVVAEKIWLHFNKKVYLNPAVLSLLVIALTLLAVNENYENYKQATRPITFMLTISTVALAFPIFKQWERLRKHLLPVAVILIIGSLIASLSAYLLAWLFSGDKAIMAAALVKSITTPIAMAVAEKIGASIPLVVVIVFVVGVVGSITAPLALRIAGINNAMLRGLVYGITAHGLGTAIAMQENEECGAFSGLAMGLTGIVTAIMVPVLIVAFHLL
ncbi:MAG: LrgB family protein [Negativicutes bacterium]|jgi:putative effector of murein hydrolase